MTNTIIFYTQILSIVVFVFTIFGLYRLLVSQKDSVIELLNEKNDYLRLQLETIKSSSPDILVERLSKRIDILKEELSSLGNDNETNAKILLKKEKKIVHYETELQKLNEQISHAKELLKEFTCPYCESPMIEHTFSPELVQNIDIDHEYISYECGLTIFDNFEKSPCKYISMEI